MSAESGRHPGLSRRTLLRTAGAAAVVGGVGGAVGTGTAAAAPPTTPPTTLPTGQVSGLVEPLRLVRVWAADAGQRRLLAGFDDTHVVHADGSVQLLLWPGDLLRLRRTGLRFAVEVDDLVAHDQSVLGALRGRSGAPARTVPPQPGESPTGDYRHLADYERELRALAAAHPDRARLLELPYRTLEGRTVLGLEIAADVERADGRPVLYVDGAHHAREWPSAEIALMWAYDLLASYGREQRPTALVDAVRCIVVPVVNPDGFDYSREFPVESPVPVAGNPVEALPLGGRGAYWRKNRRALLGRDVGLSAGGFGSSPGETAKPTDLDAYGVDPNRNYAYLWGDDVSGSSADVTSQAHRGSQPLSEQETRNVHHLLTTRNVVAMVSNHTPGDLVLWPWSYTEDAAPDEPLLSGLARAMAACNGYTAQRSNALYVQSGNTDDHAYGTTGCLAFTFEHAGTGFHPEYGSTVPAAYAKNREAFLLLGIEACMLPERRPRGALPPGAREALTGAGWDGGLAHGLVTGRAVDRRRKPVAARLELSKAFDTPLWTSGEGNPLGQPSLPQSSRTTMQAGADGRFAWQVGPSTRPAVAAAGGTEQYLLTVTGPSGEGVSRLLTVRRGERLDLGTLVVG